MNRSISIWALLTCWLFIAQPVGAEESIQSLQLAVKNRQAQFGPTDPQVADALEALGAAYLEAGSLAEAEQTFSQALHIWEKHEETGQLHITDMRYQLAQVYHAQGRQEEAEGLLKHVIAMRQIHSGADSGALVGPFISLASVYEAQGRLDEAEPIFMRIVSIREANKKAEPLLYAQSFNMLSGYYHAMKRHADAVEPCRKALEIDRNVLGDTAPEVAGDLNDLAVLNQYLGKAQEAKSLYQQAITAWGKSGQPLDAGFGETLKNYALLLQQLGEREEAQVFEARARTILGLQ